MSATGPIIRRARARPGEGCDAVLETLPEPTPGFADLLPYAALIDDGLVMTKDGSLIAGLFYGGPDVGQHDAEEKNYRTGRMNSALAGSGSGWVYHFDAVRMAAADYPAPGLRTSPMRSAG